MVLVVSTEVCLVVCRYPEIASSCILNDFPESDSGVASYIYILYTTFWQPIFCLFE